MRLARRWVHLVSGYRDCSPDTLKNDGSLKPRVVQADTANMDSVLGYMATVLRPSVKTVFQPD
jgi:hypothetical protein